MSVLVDGFGVWGRVLWFCCVFVLCFGVWGRVVWFCSVFLGWGASSSLDISVVSFLRLSGRMDVVVGVLSVLSCVCLCRSVSSFLCSVSVLLSAVFSVSCMSAICLVSVCICMVCWAFCLVSVCICLCSVLFACLCFSSSS